MYLKLRRIQPRPGRERRRWCRTLADAIAGLGRVAGRLRAGDEIDFQIEGCLQARENGFPRRFRERLGI